MMFDMTAVPAASGPVNHVAGESDLAAAKLQLAELQKQSQTLQDAQLAMQLFLEDLDGEEAALQTSASAESLELELLREQMSNLSAVITAVEDEQAALRMLDAEESSQAASLQLADALTAQEQFDATVLRPHDGALARAIASCDEWEWQQRGDCLENPLDISDRPEEPVVAVPEPLSRVIGSCGIATLHPDYLPQQQPQQQQHYQQDQRQQQQEQQQSLPPHDTDDFVMTPGLLANLDYILNVRPYAIDLAQQLSLDSSSANSHHQHAGPSSTSSYHHDGASSSGYAGASSSSGWTHGGANSSRHGGASISIVHAGASSSKAAASVQCGICFDSYAACEMVAAYDPEAACSSSSTGRCSHLYCTDCMLGYVRDKVQSRKYPIPCPDPGCHLELGVDDIQALLAGDPGVLQVFEFLVAEHLIDTARRVYCPYKDCSVLLERPEPEEEMVDEGGNQEAPYECPCCKRQFCLSCGITGWHTGLTCKDFQSLPPEQRLAEDAAVHHIAHSKAWKRCPSQGCGHMVERIEGCNHVRCFCGCSFCYACGVPYRDIEPTADNVHGTPGCGCSLFTVPEEEGEENADQQPQQQQVPAAVVLHQANRRPKPWRNGRFVSRTRCRHSESIHDCPNGPNRCWFWHDEDDE